MGFLALRSYVFGSLPRSWDIDDNSTKLREPNSGHNIPLFLSANAPSLMRSSANSGKIQRSCQPSSRLRTGPSLRGCLCSKLVLSLKDETYIEKVSHENSVLVPKRRRSSWIESASLALLILISNHSVAVAAPVTFGQVGVANTVLATSEVEVGTAPVLVEKVISLPTFSPNVNGGTDLTNEISLDIEHHIGIVVEEEVQSKPLTDAERASTAEVHDSLRKSELGVSEGLNQDSDLAKLLRGEFSKSLPKQVSPQAHSY
mmetsp:Transcript_19641/g.33677  ORF Transcript_19641/g.33677 Transcript_19641/m.33677 type:complete len:259 (-) Transcript_19641:502-1278(-)